MANLDWKTRAMASSLNSTTVGILLASIKATTESLVNSPEKLFLFSSKVLNKTKSPNLASAAVATS